MQDQALFQKIVGHIGEFVETDVSHLTPQARIATSIEGMSSLKMAELLLYLEDCFDLEFDDSVIDKLDTMQDLATYIASLQAAAAKSA